MPVAKTFSIFFLLSILLLALVPILSIAFNLSMDFDAVAEQASAKSGIAWTSNLVNLIRLCLVEPGLWLLVIGSSVPTLAALVVLLMARDTSKLKTLLRRFNPMGIESP